MLELTLTNEQKQRVTLKPTTQAGNPVEIQNPRWSVASGDAMVEVEADGLSAFLLSGSILGESTIVVEADADLGEGVELISDSIKVVTVGARAALLGLVAEPPVLK